METFTKEAVWISVLMSIANSTVNFMNRIVAPGAIITSVNIMENIMKEIAGINA